MYKDKKTDFNRQENILLLGSYDTVGDEQNIFQKASRIWK